MSEFDKKILLAQRLECIYESWGEYRSAEFITRFAREIFHAYGVF